VEDIQMSDGTNLAVAEHEFGEAAFGDERRTRRAVRMVADLLGCVGGAISNMCGHSGAQAVTRFFSCDQVTEESTLSCHRKRTVERCSECGGRILAIQDTTFLDFSTHKALEGLGPVSTGKDAKGMLMHSLLVVDEQKVPLGLLGLSLWCRDIDQHGQRSSRRSRSITEKESGKWLLGLNEADKYLGGSGKEVVVIGDRESDLWDMFAAPRSGNVHLLVRMCQNRCVETSEDHSESEDSEREKPLLLAAIAGGDVLGRYDLGVESQGRTAELEVRSRRVWLRAPKARKQESIALPCVWIVEVAEVDCPDGTEPLHWILLTSLDAGNLEQARYVINCYSARWTIEEFHKTLKSGCKVERLQFETLNRMRPAIAMLCVVAQQVMFLTKYARSCPDAPASLVSTEEERDTALQWVLDHKFATYTLETVADYVRAVAFIGNFHGRKCDGEPGVKSVWQGIRGPKHLISGRRMRPFQPSPGYTKNAIKD